MAAKRGLEIGGRRTTLQCVENPPFQAVVTIGGFLIGCVVAQARIGETEKQCDQRYGVPEVSIDKTARRYIKEGMVVFVHFYKGKCDYIGFKKLEESAAGVPKEFSENELELLLKANGDGKEWKRFENKLGVAYVTGEREVSAQYDTKERSVMIATYDAVIRIENAKKTEEEKRLKGF